MTAKPLAVFAFTHPWMQEMVLEAAPSDFEIRFLDVDNPDEVQLLLPLDVFNPEPPPSGHPTLQLPNVICTPHVATGTVEAHRLKAQAHFDNFRRVLNGESPKNIVNL